MYPNNLKKEIALFTLFLITVGFIIAYFPTILFGDQISYSFNPTTTDTLTAARYKADRNAVKNVVNGNLDNDNIKAAANIAQSKIDSAGGGWISNTTGLFVNKTGYRELHSEKGLAVFINDTVSYSNNLYIVSDSSDTIITFMPGKKVGIGTTNPSQALQIQDSTSTVSLEVGIYNETNSSVPLFSFQKSDTSEIGTLRQTDDSDALGEIRFQGVNNSNVSNFGATMKVIQNGAAGTRLPSDMFIETYSSSALNTNQLVLENDGQVGVGTATPTQKLEVNGDAKCDTLRSDGTIINARAQMGILAYGSPETLTISSTTVTPTQSYIKLTGGGGTDDTLRTITATNFKLGDIIIIERAAGTLVIDDSVGNITTGADRVLDGLHDVIMLLKNSSLNWVQISYANNS